MSGWDFACVACDAGSSVAAVGKYMPANAKRYGASFGFCDGAGFKVPRAEATHFGWTASKAPEAR